MLCAVAMTQQTEHEAQMFAVSWTSQGRCSYPHVAAAPALVAVGVVGVIALAHVCDLRGIVGDSVRQACCPRR